jgi:hypothetical protein
MRASEFIIEGGMKKMNKMHKAAMKSTTTFPGLNMNSGSMYTNYRFHIALAGAPDYPTKADNYIAGDPLISPYTEEEMDMINMAAAQVGAGEKQVWSSKRSEELPGVNTVSPIANWMKNETRI